MAFIDRPDGAHRPYVEAWLADGRLLRDLADASGIAPETLRKIRTGNRAATRFRVADAIITAIDVMLWHRPPPSGLGDLYGSPDRRRKRR